MKEHKFTDDEIIRALEACKSGYCTVRKCPFYDATEDDDICACTSRLSNNALALVNRQKAENERLTAMVEAAEDYLNPLPFKNAYDEAIDKAKSEAIKEFAERLKEQAMQKFDWNEYVEVDEIDKLVKEMTEEMDNERKKIKKYVF